MDKVYLVIEVDCEGTTIWGAYRSRLIAETRVRQLERDGHSGTEVEEYEIRDEPPSYVRLYTRSAWITLSGLVMNETRRDSKLYSDQVSTSNPERGIVEAITVLSGVRQRGHPLFGGTFVRVDGIKPEFVEEEFLTRVAGVVEKGPKGRHDEVNDVALQSLQIPDDRLEISCRPRPKPDI